MQCNVRSKNEKKTFTLISISNGIYVDAFVCYRSVVCVFSNFIKMIEKKRERQQKWEREYKIKKREREIGEIERARKKS